jgi:hypothetical protein
VAADIRSASRRDGADAGGGARSLASIGRDGLLAPLTERLTVLAVLLAGPRWKPRRLAWRICVSGTDAATLRRPKRTTARRHLCCSVRPGPVRSARLHVLDLLGQGHLVEGGFHERSMALGFRGGDEVPAARLRGMFPVRAMRPRRALTWPG